MVFESALHDGAIAISIARNHVALFARERISRAAAPVLLEIRVQAVNTD